MSWHPRSSAAVLVLLLPLAPALSPRSASPPHGRATAGVEEGCTGTDPAWSPDGEWLVFVAWCDGRADLYRMRPDGSERTRLTGSPGEEHTPAWSPDGERIAYTYRADGEDSEIWTVAPDGSDAHPLTEDGFSEVGPVWSPDGTRLAYESRRDGNGDIFVLDLKVGHELRLTSDSANDVAPAWSPDGRTIAFQSDREGLYGIWAVDPDGGQVRPLFTPDTHATTPSWSPDGSELVVAHHGDGRGELYRVRLADETATRLTRNERTDYAPKWSPDGRRIAFIVREGEAWNVFVMEADGSGERRLTGLYPSSPSASTTMSPISDVPIPLRASADGICPEPSSPATASSTRRPAASSPR